MIRRKGLFGLSRQSEKRSLEKEIQDAATETTTEEISCGDTTLSEALSDPIARTKFACAVTWEWVCKSNKTKAQGVRELQKKLELSPEFIERANWLATDYFRFRQPEGDITDEVWSLSSDEPLHTKSDSLVTLYLADARRENYGEDMPQFQELISKLGETSCRKHVFSVRPDGIFTRMAAARS